MKGKQGDSSIRRQEETNLTNDFMNLNYDDREQNDVLKVECRPLFGGALHINVPFNWHDVSSVRQVPDNQEVFNDFTEMDGAAPVVGKCLIVEILERQNDVSDEEAASFFFLDLAQQNDSRKDVRGGNVNPILKYDKIWSVGFDPGDTSDITDEKCAENLVPLLNTRTKACICAGIQKIQTTGNDGTKIEDRFERVFVEICALRLKAVQTDLLISLIAPLSFSAGDKNIEEGSKISKPTEEFKKILSGFEVRDWTLFV